MSLRGSALAFGTFVFQVYPFDRAVLHVLLCEKISQFSLSCVCRGHGQTLQTCTTPPTSETGESLQPSPSPSDNPDPLTPPLLPELPDRLESTRPPRSSKPGRPPRPPRPPRPVRPPWRRKSPSSPILTRPPGYPDPTHRPEPLDLLDLPHPADAETGQTWQIPPPNPRPRETFCIRRDNQ